MKIKDSLQKIIEAEVRENESLKKYTTWGVGGVADFFVNIELEDDLPKAYKFAIENNIPVTVLGGGANVLIGDKGIRGIVIKNSTVGITDIKEIDLSATIQSKKNREETRWNNELFALAAKEELSVTRGFQVEVLSGTTLPYLINTTLSRGYTGLEWFSRIPGTVGGAVWNNIHGAHKFFGDYIESVKYLDKKSLDVINVPHDECGFGYNKSIFQKNDKLILSAVLNLFSGDVERSKNVSAEWIKYKNKQPYNSGGSVFSNFTEEQKSQYGLGSLSASFFIDKVLHLSGTQVGDAQICEGQANFIINLGNATAQDILELISIVKKKAKKTVGIEMKEEVVKLGEF